MRMKYKCEAITENNVYKTTSNNTINDNLRV